MKTQIALLLAASIWVFAPARVHACQCGIENPTKNAWETVQLRSKSATAIFEGKLVRRQVKWIVFDAKAGELIPASRFEDMSKNQFPHMIATFEVDHAFKGKIGNNVEISTGLGGGDCGAIYSTGITYLIYAFGPDLNHLSTSMCSPGGWIESNSLAADLRYLRNERPIRSDLVLPERWTEKNSAKIQAVKNHVREQEQQRFNALTGKICGTVVREDLKDGNFGSIFFLSTTGYSPGERSQTVVGKDGSYCSPQLGPGKYHLCYWDASDQKLNSAAFYSGVDRQDMATAVEIGPGQTISNIVFKVPQQKTYSVRGFISTDDKSKLTETSVTVKLLRPEQHPAETWYQQPVNFEGYFPLPKTKYFKFENVLPGHYIVYVTVSGSGWWSKKVEVDVPESAGFVSLQLSHKTK